MTAVRFKILQSGNDRDCASRDHAGEMTRKTGKTQLTSDQFRDNMRNCLNWTTVLPFVEEFMKRLFGLLGSTCRLIAIIP